MLLCFGPQPDDEGNVEGVLPPLSVVIIAGVAAFSPASVKVADVEGPVSIVINGVEAGETDETGFFSTVLGEGKNRVAAFIPGVAAGVAFVEVEAGEDVDISIEELEGEALTLLLDYSMIVLEAPDGDLNLGFSSFTVQIKDSGDVVLKPDRLASVFIESSEGGPATNVTDLFELQNNGNISAIDVGELRNELSSIPGTNLMEIIAEDDRGFGYLDTIPINLL